MESEEAERRRFYTKTVPISVLAGVALSWFFHKAYERDRQEERTRDIAALSAVENKTPDVRFQDDQIAIVTLHKEEIGTPRDWLCVVDLTNTGSKTSQEPDCHHRGSDEFALLWR